GVPGVIAVPPLGRVYASATNAPEVLTVDADAGDLLARAAAGQYPDGLRPGRAPRLRLGRERRRRDGPERRRTRNRDDSTRRRGRQRPSVPFERDEGSGESGAHDRREHGVAPETRDRAAACGADGPERHPEVPRDPGVGDPRGGEEGSDDRALAGWEPANRRADGLPALGLEQGGGGGVRRGLARDAVLVAHHLA